MLLPLKKKGSGPTAPPNTPGSVDPNYYVPDSIRLLKLKDVTERGGEYKAVVQINPQYGAEDPDKELGQDWTDDETSIVYALYAPELGSDSHGLAVDGTVKLLGFPIGRNDTDGKAVYLLISAPASGTAVLSIGSPVAVGYGFPSVRWAFKVSIGAVTINTPSDLAVVCGDTLALNPPDEKCIFVNSVNNYTFTSNSAQTTSLTSTVSAIKIATFTFGPTWFDTAERGKTYDVYMGTDVHIGNNVVTTV